MRTLALALLLFVALPAAAAGPEEVGIAAGDGFVLKATYTSPGTDGPGILLLHQCNGERSMYDGLAAGLAGAGFHVLALDYRGYGGSKSESFDMDRATGADERSRLHGFATQDVAAAYRYLVGRAGVDAGRIGTTGASCGGNRQIALAADIPGIRALVFLSAYVYGDATTTFDSIADRPVLLITAEKDDQTTESLQGLFARSTHPDSRLILYKGEAHGAPLFEQDPHLERTIVRWYTDRLRP